jgi:hypothetical protein
MRRIWLLALAVTAMVVFPASALASGAHHHHKKKKSAKKPPAGSYKSGSYKATTTSAGEPFTITLASGKVSIPSPPQIACGPLANTPTGSFATPVALSASGSVTEQATTSVTPVVGTTPLTGPSSFTATFTKNGTATGDLEVSLTGTFGSEPFSCTSGKVPFTAKLG